MPTKANEFHLPGRAGLEALPEFEQVHIGNPDFVHRVSKAVEVGEFAIDPPRPFQEPHDQLALTTAGLVVLEHLLRLPDWARPDIGLAGIRIINFREFTGLEFPQIYHVPVIEVGLEQLTACRSGVDEDGVSHYEHTFPNYISHT